MQQLIEFAANHLLLVAGFLAVILLLAWTEINRHIRGFDELTPVEAVRKINQGKISVVDISTAAEFAKGHLAGAKNIALSRFNTPDADIEKLKAKAVLVVCKNGQSAHQAAARLVKLGAEDVAILKGGVSQWTADQYPLSRK